MTTLRLIIDEMVGTAVGPIGRYTEELARGLIQTAPRGCFVEGFVAASTEPEYAEIAERLPGLATLHKSSLARRELRAAWQHGFTRLPGKGMVHAPSLFASLSRHDRLNEGDQIAVTIHDTVAWSHPDSLPPRSVSWQKAMAKRVERYADAVVVPSHAVADQVSDLLDLGDRVRVISGAARTTLVPGDDADLRAAELALPERYVLAIGGLEPRRGIDELVRAMARVDGTVPLLLVGPGAGDEELAAAIAETGLDEHRVRGLGPLDDSSLAVAVSRAAVFVYPNIEEGFGMPILEAFSLGAPVVHSDAPALLELSADSGLAVTRDGEGYAERLADAITGVLEDSRLAERLRYSGFDRSRAYSWPSAAEKVWQLHADL